MWKIQWEGGASWSLCLVMGWPRPDVWDRRNTKTSLVTKEGDDRLQGGGHVVDW